LAKSKNAEEKQLKRFGHAFSIINTIDLPDKNKSFLKMYNCQKSMKLSRERNKSILFLTEFIK
jgi:hypothetical protein